MYLIHYVLQNNEDNYKHIHGSVIYSGRLSLNNFYDTIVNKEISKVNQFNITIVGWNKI